MAIKSFRQNILALALELSVLLWTIIYCQRPIILFRVAKSHRPAYSSNEIMPVSPRNSISRTFQHHSCNLHNNSLRNKVFLSLILSQRSWSDSRFNIDMNNRTECALTNRVGVCPSRMLMCGSEGRALPRVTCIRVVYRRPLNVFRVIDDSTAYRRVNTLP